MPLARDAKAHLYAEVGNIRITYVPSAERQPSKDWASSDVLRIQAYKGGKDMSLFPGAEIPIPTSRVFVELIAALRSVYSEGKGSDD